MAIDRLVWNCFQQHTSFEEEKLKVTAKPSPNQKILFFSIDSLIGRASLGLAESAPICDVAVFFRNLEEIPVLLLIELKGSDLGHAVLQLNTAYNAIRRLLPHHDMCPSPRMRGLIVVASGSPTDQAKALSKAENGLSVKVKTGMRGRSLSIEEYLTKTDASFSKP